jgi:6-phosphogluconate dehydrogenase
MEVGMIGLGRMGLNMATRLVRHGHKSFGYDISPTKEAEAKENGIQWARSIEELVESLPTPRLVWIMVPQGEPVDEAISQALPKLAEGDIVVTAAIPTTKTRCAARKS